MATKKAKAGKGTRVVKVMKTTKVKQTKEGKKRDAALKAKKAGVRKTAHGTKYTETRSNRSDE